jgi:toxin ParE1/3/4
LTKAVFSPRARSDVADIWDYTLANWGEARAERYVRAIQFAVAELVTNPQLGRSCEDIRAGCRKYPVGSHVVFYRLVGSDTGIVRTLHQNMDVDRHL